MSMNETMRRLAEQKNRQTQGINETNGSADQRSEMGENIHNSGDQPNGLSGQSTSSSASATGEQLRRERFQQLIEQIEEMSARLQTVEQLIALQRPDAERFAKEVGPMVLAAKKLREEVESHDQTIRKELAGQKTSLAASLKEVKELFAAHETQNAESLKGMRAAVAACRLAVEQNTNVFQETTAGITTVKLQGVNDIAAITQRAQDAIEQESQRLSAVLSGVRLPVIYMLGIILAVALGSGVAVYMLNRSTEAKVYQAVKDSLNNEIDTYRKAERWEQYVWRQKWSEEQRKGIEAAVDAEIKKRGTLGEKEQEALRQSASPFALNDKPARK